MLQITQIKIDIVQFHMFLLNLLENSRVLISFDNLLIKAVHYNMNRKQYMTVLGIDANDVFPIASLRKQTFQWHPPFIKCKESNMNKREI